MFAKLLDTLITNFPERYLLPYATIVITGPDRLNYLQGQVSANMHLLTDERVIPGLYCNRQGRILTDFWAWQRSEAVYLMMHHTLIDKVFETLQHYAMFSKVAIEKGNEAISFSLTTNMASSSNYQVTDDEIVIANDYVNLFIGAENNMLDNNNTAEPLWTYLRINLKQPYITSDTSEKFLPHRLGFHEMGYIDFKKGCYLGQEVIARMHYKSQHKHAVFYVSTEASIIPNEILETEETKFKLDIINYCRFNDKTHLLISCDKNAFGVSKLKQQEQTFIVEWHNHD